MVVLCCLTKLASDYCLTPIQQFFSAISWREQVDFQWDDGEVQFVLDQHAELDFHSLTHSLARSRAHARTHARTHSNPDLSITNNLGRIIKMVAHYSDQYVHPSVRLLSFHILPNSLYIIIKLGAVHRQKQHLHFYFFLSQIIGGQNIAWTYLEDNLKIQLIHWLIDLIVGVLTPLSTIFQLYHGDQFQW